MWLLRGGLLRRVVASLLCVLLAGLPATFIHVVAFGFSSEVDVLTKIKVDEKGDAGVYQYITFDPVAVRAISLMGMDLHSLGGVLVGQVVAELSRRGVKVGQPRVDVSGNVINLGYAISPLAVRIGENKWEIKIEKTVQSMGETLPKFFSVVIDLEIVVELPPRAVCVLVEVDGVRTTCDNPKRIQRRLSIVGGERIAIESPGIHVVYELPVEKPVEPVEPPNKVEQSTGFEVGVKSVDKSLVVGEVENILIPVTNNAEKPLKLVLSLSGDTEAFSLKKTSLDLPPKTTTNIVVETHPHRPEVFLCKLVLSSPEGSVSVPIRVEAVQPQPAPKILQVFPFPSSNNPEKLVVTISNPGGEAEASLEVVISNPGYRTTIPHRLTLTEGMNQYHFPLKIGGLKEGQYNVSTTLKTSGQNVSTATSSFSVKNHILKNFNVFFVLLVFAVLLVVLAFVLAKTRDRH